VNKAELISRVSERVEGGRSAATTAVDAVFDAIQEAVAQGDRVAITGFGVFEKVERAARTGRNPQTGEPVEVKAASVPKFRAGSDFKAYVNGAKEFARTAVTSARSAAASSARAVGDVIDPPASQASAPPAKKAAAKKAQKSAQKAAKKAPAKKATKSSS
jgi:DNA-binding protein HU-beta